MISVLQKPLILGLDKKLNHMKLSKILIYLIKISLLPEGYSGIGLETTKALKKANAKSNSSSKRLIMQNLFLKGIVPQNDIYEMDLADLNSVMNFVELFSMATKSKA